MNADERERLAAHFELGFRELQLRDITLSDESDVRMGTFVQCAAFLDALALAYSAEETVPEKKRGIWRRFVEAYFPPEYAQVAAAYHGFRSLLLHNFSAGDSLGFTHAEPGRHLRDEGGHVILDRGSFVAAVAEAFEQFYRDVLADDAIAERVLRWLDAHPPIGFWVPEESRVLSPAGAETGPLALTAASFSTTSVLALSATGSPPSDPAGWTRGPDRPRPAPSTSTIKSKPKKRKKPKGRGKR